MPPHQGVFPIPYSSGGQKTVVGPASSSAALSRQLGGRGGGYGAGNGLGAHGGMNGTADMMTQSIEGMNSMNMGMGNGYQHIPPHGPVPGAGSRMHGPSTLDDGKRDGNRRRREIAGKVGKEMSERVREESARSFAESISMLHTMTMHLSTQPETVPLYKLRLLPISLERSALLVQLEFEEKYSVEGVQTAYDEERERVEDEWRRGRDRVRERLMEGIEERRRRAREDKEGEGTVGDVVLDAQTRPHITRKLRNKMGTSPPPTPQGAPNGVAAISHLPITNGPFLNPNSLSVDEIPSPFPLPLTSTPAPNGANNGGSGGTGGGGGGGRRRPKGGGGHQGQNVGGLGKSISMLSQNKESEIEGDLIEIRRGNKRRRTTLGKSAV